MSSLLSVPCPPQTVYRLAGDILDIKLFPAPKASRLLLEMIDRRTGLRRSSPVVTARIMWDAVQRSEDREDADVLAIRQTEANALEIDFRTPRSRISWSVRFSLEGERLTLLIPWTSLSEDRRRHFRLMELVALPELMSGSGTFLVPLKCGGLIHPQRHLFPFSDRVLIYGYQPRHEDLPLLPLAGYYEPGRLGLATIVAQGECDAYYQYRQSGEGSASSSFSLAYRHHWASPLDPIDRELHVISLDVGCADYSGMGRLYHRFLRHEEDVSTLREKARGNPYIAELSRSMVLKTFHGMKDLDREDGDGVYHLHQSFQETAWQLRCLKAAGIHRAAVQLVGWNLDGHDGAYPTRFPVDARPGGESGFRRLVKEGQELGYQMQVHDNYVDCLDPGHPGLIRRIWGEPVGRGIWGGGAIYALNPRKVEPSFIRTEMERVKALGVKGVYYLDAMAPPLEEDYDPAVAEPRRQHAVSLSWLLGEARAVFGACGIEMGFAHLAKHADYVASSLLRGMPPVVGPEKNLIGLVSEWVPVWHIAFHGLLAHALLDCPVPSAAKLLEAAETGALPRCDFTGSNPGPGPIFAVQWHEALLPIYKAKYDLLLASPLGENVMAVITRHRSLGHEVYETTFENGNVVRVDYRQLRLWCNGIELEIPPIFDQELPVRLP